MFFNSQIESQCKKWMNLNVDAATLVPKPQTITKDEDSQHTVIETSKMAMRKIPVVCSGIHI